ncbi:MAG: type I methionyl aminopeptidase [Phycisphaerales bacterium]|jgi:methionyl aminopeptidase|nr:type I methionyl aminopeptidase [Phycisphaerales bacterium]
MIVKKPSQVSGARAAAMQVCRVHEALTDFLGAGRTLPEVDAFVGQTLRSLRSKSCFLRYRIPGQRPFPSHSCLSLNECVVHGTHLDVERPLRDGDVLSVDIGVLHKGWIGDAAWTYGIVDVSDQARRLMAVGVESLRRGIAAMQPGRPLIDWARAVQACVEDEAEFSLVRGLGGHGYGTSLHSPPFVSNVVPTTPNEWPDAFRVFEPGMLLAVEPMLAAGNHEVTSEPLSWPIRTVDGGLTAHYEADVLITDEGHEVLTADMFNLPDLVG